MDLIRIGNLSANETTRGRFFSLGEILKNQEILGSQRPGLFRFVLDPDPKN